MKCLLFIIGVIQTSGLGIISGWECNHDLLFFYIFVVKF